MKLWRTIALACAVHAAAAAAALPESEASDPCANAGTQAARGDCSYEGFLQASAAMSGQLRQLEAALKPGQRTTWRRVQKAWLTYRTQACHFESSQLATSGERARAQWTCAARMTRERTAELSRVTACGDGAAACAAPIRSGGKLSSIFSRRR